MTSRTIVGAHREAIGVTHQKAAASVAYSEGFGVTGVGGKAISA
ncbi:MAG TPA: hypothetical protein VGB52_05130 [Actinomycetota bacterium]